MHSRFIVASVEEQARSAFGLSTSGLRLDACSHIGLTPRVHCCLQFALLAAAGPAFQTAQCFVCLLAEPGRRLLSRE